MAPIVHGLEDIYQDRINFVYLDVDDPATIEFKRYFAYQYQPEYYLIDGNGEILMAWFGFVPPEAFMTVFEAALANQG